MNFGLGFDSAMLGTLLRVGFVLAFVLVNLMFLFARELQPTPAFVIATNVIVTLGIALGYFTYGFIDHTLNDTASSAIIVASAIFFTTHALDVHRSHKNHQDVANDSWTGIVVLGTVISGYFLGLAA